MPKSQPDKFAELMLYIAKVCEDDPNFGATKLNKILFFSDFSAYRKWQKSITSATYQKLAHGPAPQCLVPVRDRLISDGSLEIREVDRYTRMQKRPVARREPNLDAFTANEIALVDAIIDAMKDANATAVSEASHGFWWQVAEIGEDIPIGVSLVEFPEEVSPEEQLHAQSLEQRACRLITAA